MKISPHSPEKYENLLWLEGASDTWLFAESPLEMQREFSSWNFYIHHRVILALAGKEKVCEQQKKGRKGETQINIKFHLKYH